MTSAATAFAGARLLVVDDEVAQMQALCNTLEYEGYRPTGFSSAKQALAQLRPGEHDLLLTDLMMPEIDGIEFIRSARATDPELAGIVMTGHGTIDTAVEAMRVGALDYVLKPFKLNVILTVIVRALDIRRLRIENAALQQREREQAVELAAAYRDLESFSYSVSHDLRSPLRVVNGFMDLFMEEFGHTVSGEARSRLEQVRAGGARMDRLIEDLLKFCQFSRAPLTRRRVDLGGIVRRVAAELQAREPKRTVQVDIGELPAVAGDASLLEQVIVNLLSNAFKFTRHQAQACVSVGSFAAPDPAAPNATERVYFVRDNGAGFDMKYAGKLFGVFQRLHSQEQFEGTGVGLSIVQRVLQRHGGRIWAESAPGSGATSSSCCLSTRPDNRLPEAWNQGPAPMQNSTPNEFWRRSRARLALGSGLGLLMLAVSPPPASAAPEQNLSTAALKSLSVEELMDLEVTSVSKRPEKLSETASAIQVITREDIRRAGATTLAEALRLAPNLQVAQKNAHSWGISARGFNTDLSNKLLVLVDGRTVYTPLYSGVFWDGQDYLLEDVERIEVISGPGGTLWGANAVNGVINITTRNARETQGLAMEAGGGTELQDFAGVRYGGSLASNMSYRLYAKHFERDDSVLSDGRDASDSWHMTQGGFRLDAEPATQNLLTVQGDVYRTEEELVASDSSRLSGANILGRWSQVYSDDSSMSLQAYYDHTHLSLPTASNGFAPAGVFTDDLDTYDLDFQHHFRLAANQQVVWGLGYRFTHDVVGAAPALALLPPRLDHHLFSGFLEDKLQLQDNLFLTLGTKLEHNDYTGLEYEPSARLQWNYASAQMLWAAVSRAVRTPSRIDRDLREPTLLPAPFPASIINGGDDFSSETLIAYELGHRAQFGARLATSLSLFYNDYSDVRSTTPAAPGFPSFGFPLVFANALEGETHGLELSATYQPFDAWRLRGGYNLLEEHLHVKPGGVDFSNARNETADPEQQITLHSALDLPANLQLDIGLRWVDTLHNNNGPTPGTVPSYVEADARVGWRLSGNVEFSIVGQNLLHDHHPEYGFPGPLRPEVERGVYGKVLMSY